MSVALADGTLHDVSIPSDGVPLASFSFPGRSFSSLSLAAKENLIDFVVGHLAEERVAMRSFSFSTAISLTFAFARLPEEAS
jgi:hypothetical protein